MSPRLIRYISGSVSLLECCIYGGLVARFHNGDKMINEIFDFDVCDSAGFTYAPKNEMLHLILNREHNLGLVSVDNSNFCLHMYHE